MNSWMGLDVLKGRTVIGLWRDAAKENLKFLLDGGETLYIYADGDCCSYSWIEHINGVSQLLGYRVNDVIRRESVECAESDDYDSILSYGYSLVTSIGTCDLELRNRSNGYYGGEFIILDPTSLDHIPSEWIAVEDY